MANGRGAALGAITVPDEVAKGVKGLAVTDRVLPNCTVDSWACNLFKFFFSRRLSPARISLASCKLTAQTFTWVRLPIHRGISWIIIQASIPGLGRHWAHLASHRRPECGLRQRGTPQYSQGRPDSKCQ